MDSEKIEAQDGVVGSMLTDPAKMKKLFTDVRAKKEWFDPPYRKVVETIQELWNDRDGVDLLTVVEKMRLDGTLKGVGGANFLEECVLKTPTSANAEFYMNILRNKGIRAMFIQVARGLIQRLSTESPDMVVMSAANEFRNILETFSVKKEKTAGEIYFEIVEGWEKAHQDQMKGIRPNVGLHMPWWRLTKLYGGLVPGLHLLCAMPSEGKSTMEALVRHKALTDGYKTLTVELDMNPHGLLKRDLARLAQVSMKKLDFGYAREDQIETTRKWAKELAMLPQRFVFSNTSLDVMCATAYEMKAMDGLDLITIDCGQMLTLDGIEEGNIGLEVKKVGARLKGLSHDLNIPIFCLLHLKKPENRKVAMAPPTLDDIWGGKYWESYAASAAMLYRNRKLQDEWVEAAKEKYFEARQTRKAHWREFRPKRPMFYELAKNQNGETGCVQFLMNPGYFQFLLADKDFQEEPDDAASDVDDIG